MVNRKDSADKYFFDSDAEEDDYGHGNEQHLTGMANVTYQRTGCCCC